MVSGLSSLKCFGMQAHLALCCKALLPILGMGHVRVNLDAPKTGRPLLNATRCLRKQPSGVSHLEVFSRDYSDSQRKTRPATRQLVNLRCAHAPCGAGLCRVWPLGVPWPSSIFISPG